jgi:hypothetical protein
VDSGILESTLIFTKALLSTSGFLVKNSNMPSMAVRTMRVALGHLMEGGNHFAKPLENCQCPFQIGLKA